MRAVTGCLWLVARGGWLQANGKRREWERPEIGERGSERSAFPFTPERSALKRARQTVRARALSRPLWGWTLMRILPRAALIPRLPWASLLCAVGAGGVMCHRDWFVGLIACRALRSQANRRRREGEGKEIVGAGTASGVLMNGWCCSCLALPPATIWEASGFPGTVCDRRAHG
jgi:hypothetical protein